MISSIAWVPRGVAKAHPDVVQPSEEELEAARRQVEAQAGLGSDEDEEDQEEDEEDEGMDTSDDDAETDAVAHAKAAAATLASGAAAAGSKRGSKQNTDSIEAALKELDMEHYDDDDGTPSVVQRALGGRLEIHQGEDPYVTLPGSDDEDSEIEDLEIKPDDLLILAARNEDDISNLEVWVYEEAETLGAEANVYVHHELMLPAFPLCVAWMDCDPAGSTAPGNFVAVCTMDPGIEIWNLDVVDAVEPVATLGGEDKAAAGAALAAAEEAAGGKLDRKKKKKLKEKAKKKGPTVVPGSHTDSVLGCAWNMTFRNVLATASADHTVKVWDVTKQAAEHTLTHHSSKVQAVCWNPVEAPVLLTGGFDAHAALVDVRTPGASPAMWKLSADVEAVAWCPHAPTNFMVSSEDGVIAQYDARQGAGSAPLFRLAAHSKPTCALSFCPSPAAPGLLATGSTDKKVKLWDVSAAGTGSGAPVCLATQDLQVGAVFTLGWARDAPHLLAVGGAKGSVTVWDVRAHAGVAGKFSGLLPAHARGQAAAKEDA